MSTPFGHGGDKRLGRIRLGSTNGLFRGINRPQLKNYQSLIPDNLEYFMIFAHLTFVF